MSTKYFIMTKPSKTLVNENKNNQIIYTNNQDTHILPQSNIKYYLENGLFESNLIEWCKQLCNNKKVFLDIGAHTGTYSISLSDYCLHVHSFEPQKMTFYSSINNFLNL
jgi:hypothetical protein